MNAHGERAGVTFAVETVDLEKHFGGVQAVDGLSIGIPKGWITCIIGPNGSGKSTFINLLSGMLEIDSGMVVIDGVGLKTVRPHDVPGLGIARTFQSVRLFDQMTVWDNLMVVQTERRLARALVERGKPALRRRTEEILREVGMWEKRRSMALDLSYGQRKLLEVGRAMALDAQTYLLDEPFAGLFPQMLERVKGIMKLLRSQGKTILFVSHNMDIVRELSDHLIVMDSGQLLLEGKVEEVLASEAVIEAYLGL